MISVMLDYDGAYKVRWPESDRDIIALGQAYVAYETARPPEDQVPAPALATVQATLDAAQAAQAAAQTGEAERAQAAETYRQTLATAKEQLDAVIIRLKAKYLDNLAQLEEWGLDTTTTSRGVSVRKPDSDSAWADFLQAYVTKESSLPAETQLSDPPLAEMEALATTLAASDAARSAGRAQREANVSARSEEAAELLDLLQVAGLVLVATRFNRQVNSELQAWGYDVAARDTQSQGPPTGGGAAG